jgi:hypothetical protein
VVAPGDPEAAGLLRAVAGEEQLTLVDFAAGSPTASSR